MKKFVFAAALFGAATLARAQAASAPQPTPAPGPSGLSPSTTNGSGMQLSTGTVTDYVAGQRIAVRISEGNEVRLDLDKNVRVDGMVTQGTVAAVMWMSDGGKPRVTSITAPPGPGDSGTASLESSYHQMSEPQARTTSRPASNSPSPTAAPRATPTPRP